MADYEVMKVGELRKLITNKDDFAEKMGTPPSSATKIKLVNYLNGHYNDAPPKLMKSPSETNLADVINNRTFDPNPPKLPKEYAPDQNKLEEIRKSMPQPEPKSQKVDVPEELVGDLDDEDVHKLSNLLSDEVCEETPSYIFNESAEIKCRRYVERFPNLKPIAASPEFKSSEEKLRYIQQHMDSTRMNANMTNWLFTVTTMMERNSTVNNYVKLKGYTKKLKDREQELEACIDEIKIKYMDEFGQYLTMPVEARLALIFFESAYATHLENKKVEAHNAIVSQQASKSTKK